MWLISPSSRGPGWWQWWGGVDHPWGDVVRIVPPHIRDCYSKAIFKHIYLVVVHLPSILPPPSILYHLPPLFCIFCHPIFRTLAICTSATIKVWVSRKWKKSTKKELKKITTLKKVLKQGDALFKLTQKKNCKKKYWKSSSKLKVLKKVFLIFFVMLKKLSCIDPNHI